jgi:CubicO group peptidase (beta-lactamase class C family)
MGGCHKHSLASITKSLAGGLPLILALGDKRLSLDDPVSLYVPAWRDDRDRSEITVRNLVTHTSGLLNGLEDPLDTGPDWARRFWRSKDDDNPFEVALREVPLAVQPGTGFIYSSPGYAMLSWVITAAYRHTDTPDLVSLLRSRVTRPTGIPDRAWSARVSYEQNGMTLVPSWGGWKMSARAVARLGQLILERGEFETRQVLDPRFVKLAVTPATPHRSDELGPYPAPGLGFWLNHDGTFPSLPRDAVFSAGSGHTLLLIVPSQSLVVVRLGRALDKEYPNASFWVPLQDLVFRPVQMALKPI